MSFLAVNNGILNYVTIFDVAVGTGGTKPGIVAIPGAVAVPWAGAVAVVEA